LSFEDALQACAGEITTLLGQLLPMGASPARRLVEAMRYAVLGEGKRLRPFLVSESAALFYVPRLQALRVGAALECVHCYSLVHDDLPAMDDDDLRRGRPTVHKAFDEATAILAGDGLLSLGFEIIADVSTHPNAAVRLALITALARASGMAGMVAGQMLDIDAETQNITDVFSIVDIQKLKTGALFRFACEAGAILGGGDPGPLRQYADNIGLAYQIADDILDVESTPTALGKATQKDRRKGKATFVDILGLVGAKERADQLAADAITALEPYGPRAERLREAAQFMVSRRK
jgi:farnesyl diphosphate synthase